MPNHNPQPDYQGHFKTSNRSNNQNNKSSSNNNSSRRRKVKNSHSLSSSSLSPSCSGSVSSCSSVEHDNSRHNGRHNRGTVASNAQQLEQTLLDLGCYEVDDSNRRAALEYIEDIISRWALTLSSLSSNYNKTNGDPWQRPRVALIPFGSYRLGVHRPESDLDVLALAPPCCTRQDFFTSLVQLLSDDPNISQVHPIGSAYTPVIKFVVNSTSLHIDLVFGRVTDTTKLLEFTQKWATTQFEQQQQHQFNKVPRDFLADMYMIDDSDLLGLDEAGVRSLNGARVSQILLEYVEPYCSLDNYRTVLRAVKQWAIKQGIYSNVLGFLGGINWAILVAFACRYNHDAKKKSAVQLLRFFFRKFASWKWPAPVLLMAIQDKPPCDNIPFLPAWNPVVNPRDGLHVMPIITPAYPSMNSSYNVGIPQLRRIQDEMIRASNFLSRNPHSYKDLLSNESDFFRRHTHFLQINIRAKNRQDFVEWFRLVESRLRLLICALETPFVHAWPFARFFERKYNSAGVCIGGSASTQRDQDGSSDEDNCLHERCFFIGLRFAPELDQINLSNYTSDFLYKVNTWEGRKVGMDLSIAHVTEDDLPTFLLEEMGMADRHKDSGGSGRGEGNGDGDTVHEERDSHDQEDQGNHDEENNPAFDSLKAMPDDSIQSQGCLLYATESSPMKKCRIMTAKVQA